MENEGKSNFIGFKCTDDFKNAVKSVSIDQGHGKPSKTIYDILSGNPLIISKIKKMKQSSKNKVS